MASAQEQILPFFGGDTRGRIFYLTNYKGAQYDKPLNTKENPDILINSPLYWLMSGKSYDKPENVIASGFSYFIMLTAFIHRHLQYNVSTYANSPGGMAALDAFKNDENPWVKFDKAVVDSNAKTATLAKLNTCGVKTRHG